MRILAVDTSTPSGSLAVLEDGRVLGLVATDVEETYSSRMFRQLDFLLRELAMEVGQFDLFAVVAGPGSFTGLRVGLTAVKGWAEVYGKPIAAVSGLEAVAAQTAGESAWIAPVMDARRGQVYGGLYQRNREGAQGDGVGEVHLERVGDEVVMTATEFLAELAGRAGGATPVFATPTPEVLASALEASAFRGARVELVWPILAPVVGRLGCEKARRGETLDALRLDANYIRRSDAELLWKG
jgi:tRNA threonylcarbamoyladenosine biosynthesis protein TsaB